MTTNSISFPYVNGTEIPVSENCLYLNSSWVHSSKDGKWDTHFVWELNVIQKFVDQIQDNFVILDIGANNGSFSLAAKFYPTTHWFCFEPDSWTCDNLRENLILNDIENVFISEYALSDKVGESILNICHSHRGLNTLGKNIVRFNKEDSYEYSVKTTTIDSLFLNKRIDLIKIDTEGSEYDIIKGGFETIKKYRPKILLEYNPNNIEQCGHSLEQLNSLIEDLNYEIFWSDGRENIFIQSR
jgi:FkbM family methyltransferase